MPNGGRVLIFTGNGKGKTTAALGLAMRAAGHGMRVFFIQFVKDRERTTGEIVFLEKHGKIELFRCGLGFIPPAKSSDYARHVKAAREGLLKARQSLNRGTPSLLVLDEICVAVHRGLLEAEKVRGVVEEVKEGQIIAMTGRNAPPELLSVSDTATEMRCIKHAFEEGRPAEKGVEY